MFMIYYHEKEKGISLPKHGSCEIPEGKVVWRLVASPVSQPPTWRSRDNIFAGSSSRLIT
jgi:hypothetical protein